MQENPYTSPQRAADGSDHAERKRLPARCWTLLAVPPLATACAFGLGIWLDSWKLGPPGVFFMVLLCGIGSPIVGMGTAGIIARRLAQGSEVKEWLVWMFEQPLVVILWLAMWQWIISLQPVPFGPGHTVLTVWLAK